ncbi:MAG: hypothetical protein H6Q31_1807 [Bacteroidetes bacterium]|nr:hypothetical protein [Bacteroidota bacterium]
MKTVLGNEILKMSLKWRSYISFITVGVIIPLLDIALLLESGGWTRSVTRGLAQDFLVMGNIKNGYFITYFILNALWIHIPFLITIGAGDQLAGEATGGTFRILLTRPASPADQVHDNAAVHRSACVLHGSTLSRTRHGTIRDG